MQDSSRARQYSSGSRITLKDKVALLQRAKESLKTLDRDRHSHSRLERSEAARQAETIQRRVDSRHGHASHHKFHQHAKERRLQAGLPPIDT